MEATKTVIKGGEWIIKEVDSKSIFIPEEFNEEQIAELFKYAKEIDATFFASVWDIPSVDLMAKYTDIGKIPSALITDLELCKYARQKFKLFMISTGMSSEEEIERCIEACDPDIIMHTNSCYIWFLYDFRN